MSKVVPFARNADRVDGFHARAVPTPGTLLPLGSDAKVPTNALPATPQPKPTRAWARYRASDPVPIPAIGELAHLPLPAANVVVRAKAAFSLAGPSYSSPGPTLISCQLTLGSEVDRVIINVSTSTYYQGGSIVVPFEVAAHAAGPRTAVLACEEAGNAGSGNVRVRAIRISALEIDQLTNAAED
jgi:hypothetical protein